MMHCSANGPITPGGRARAAAATKRSPISKAFSSIDSVSVVAMWPASSSRIVIPRTARTPTAARSETFEVRLPARVGAEQFELAQQRRVEKVEIDRRPERVLLDPRRARPVGT